jgi:hypothetical protein
MPSVRLLASRPVIVTIYSPAPQSGKSTISNLIEDDFGRGACAGPFRVSFASCLKSMLESVFAYDMPEADKLNFPSNYPYPYIYGDRKEVPLEMFGGHSTRYAMQKLAIWGKENFGDDFWLKKGVIEASHFIEKGWDVVIDDMRYKNEYDALKAKDAIFIKVVRPGARVPEQHFGSEGNLENEDFDITLVNDFPDVESFREFASYVLKKRIPEIVDLRDSQKGF